MSHETLEIFASRWIEASIALTFRAFTEPALLERWFCPSPEVALRVERHEPRVGGGYRFVFHFPDGRTVPVVGEYRVFDPPHTLVFTWTWEEPDPWAGVVTLVSVNLMESKDGTSVEVHHTQLQTSEMKLMHESGWAATLSRLDPLLATLFKSRRDHDNDNE